MAKKSESSTSCTQILSEIRAGRFAPFYLLSGDEPFFIDAIMEALQQRVVTDEAARDFDLTLFYGTDSTADQIAGAARQLPIMGERTLVMLKEAQAMLGASKALATLAPVALKPGDKCVVAIAYKGESLKATHELVKAVKKGGGIIFTSTRLKEWELNAYITDYCTAKKIKIDRKAAELLKEYIGSDLSRMARTIDKLSVAAPSGMITAELIEAQTGVSKDFNNFELIKALSLRDYAKAMKIVDYFENNPKNNPVIMTTALLFRFFSQLMLAHYAPDKTDRGLMNQLGFSSPYQLTDLKPALRNFPAASTLRIIHAIRDLDCGAKGIGTMKKDYDLLKEFIYKAFTL